MPVQKESIESTMVRIRKFIDKCIEKKGDDAFRSTHESLGKMTEEFFEVVSAVRANNASKFIKEAMDLAVSAIWSVVSASELFEPEMATADDIFKHLADDVK